MEPTLSPKVTVDSQAVWPPVSRYGFQIEDTGHMYVIGTPMHIKIQWLHSSGLMILEASKASKAQGRGLCGELGPSYGEGGCFPGYLCTHTQVFAGTGLQGSGALARRLSVLCPGTDPASRDGTWLCCQLAVPSASFPNNLLKPDDLPICMCLVTSQSTCPLTSH